MLHFIKRISMRKHLLLLVAITHFVAFLVAAGLLVNREIHAIQHAAVRHLTVTAHTLGTTATATLVFEDQDSAYDILATLKNQASITYAAIYDKNGQLFTHFAREAIAQDETVLTPFYDDKHRFTANYLEMSHHISLNDQIIGWIYLRYDLKDLRENLKHYIFFITVIFLVSLGVALLLSFFLQQMISKPILHLLEVVKRATDNNDYTRRANHPLSSNRESGELIDYFNKLLTQIETCEAALKKAEIAADSMSCAKSQFLNTISHKVRTPMNGVLGMTELLLETQLTEQQRHLTETVHHSGQAVLNIINDILDFSKIEAGHFSLNIIDIKLHQLIEETIESFAMIAYQKKLELICFLPTDLPLHAQGDPARLQQLLANFISNAIEFTEQGEVIVRVIVVEQTEDTILLRFEVEDTGIGITPDTMKQLFQPFNQLIEAHQYQGAGLSLAISKQLARMMGGEVGVHSHYQQGSIFWFTTRLEKQPLYPDPPLFSCQNFSATRILIVDDNATSCEVLRHYFHAWGLHNSNTVHTGEQALSMLREAASQGKPYEIVCIDTDLSKYYAETTLIQAIKTDTTISQVNIIALSSNYETVATTVLCTLKKPIRQQALYQGITAAIGQRPILKQRPISGTESRFQAHVLLAEDNPVNQKVARLMLSKLGCQVDIVNNGLEVMKALEKKSYDVIFMDCQMPEMDGFAVTRIIRAQEYARIQKNIHIPIIALTAHAMEGDREQCLKVGMDDYLGKPFNKEQLCTVLEKWLNISK